MFVHDPGAWSRRADIQGGHAAVQAREQALGRYTFRKHKAAAVYVGGGLQLLFGIKGKRWDTDEYPHMYNEHWVYASTADKPAGFKMVEGGAYWGP